MIEWTPEAKRRMEEYVARVRATLRGSATRDDVEQSVREHVEIALAGVPGPIGAERLSAVLEQLGAPDRWVSEDELPAWRRVMLRFSEGPDDWRLAYASFAITLLMFVTFPIGGILLLIPAFLLSRAAIDLLTARGEAVGSRRWLLLPPIAIVLAFVTGIALIGPVIAAGAIGLGDEQIYYVQRLDRDVLSNLERIRIETGFLAAAAGIWWIVLAGIYTIAYRPYRALFLPLTATLRRGHALVLTIVGVVFAAIGAVLLFVV